MKAAVVTIGDEILIGQIIDTNSGFIAQQLDSIGVAIDQMLSIGDNESQILATFERLQNQVDLVIITGGLGPTKDDITKKLFAKYFNDTLIQNDEVLAHVTRLIEQFYKRPISQINKDQALVPSKSVVLFNDFGTAPGMWMQKEGTIFISLPGVPYEMKHLVQSQVLPRLMRQFDRPFFIHKTIIVYGVGESLLAEQIENWENNLPEYIKLAYLPSPGRVRLRLSARGKNQTELLSRLQSEIETLIQILGKDILIGLDENQPVEFALGKLLKERNETLSVAESCTGGLISSRIVSVAGASQYFIGSIVSYATAIKVTELNVSQSSVDNYSVVSDVVAKEMAVGIKNKFLSTYSIAITGNAGPVSSTTENDLGVVFVAIAHPKGVFYERLELGQPREKVIQKATNVALEMLLKFISKN